MTLVLDATVGGASANAYDTKANATSYFEGRLNATAWTSNAAKQEIALVMATGRIDQERFQGAKAAETQRLKWPRADVYDEDGLAVADTIIPRQIKEAVFELALYLLQQGASDPTTATGLESFSSLTLGDVSLEMRDSAGQPLPLPPNVARLLAGYRIGGGGAVRLLRA